MFRRVNKTTEKNACENKSITKKNQPTFKLLRNNKLELNVSVVDGKVKCVKYSK